MKIRYEISKSVLVSILLLILGMVFSIKGLVSIHHNKNSISLNELTMSHCREGIYVTGEISSYVIAKLEGTNTDCYSGQSEEYLAFGKTYITYTVPVADNYYIRVMVCKKETVEGLERLLKENGEKVFLEGVLTKPNSDIHTQWYDKIPNFDTDHIIQTVVLEEMDIKSKQNALYLGVVLLIAAVLIYRKSGGIKKKEIETQPISSVYGNYVNSYNKKNELEVQKNSLETYKKRKQSLRRWAIMGIVMFMIGICIIVSQQYFEDQIIGFVFILFSLRYIWEDFIHSNWKLSIGIAKMLHIKTLQDDIRDCEEKIRVLTQLLQEEIVESDFRSF